MPSFICIKGRYPYKAMNTCFTLQITISVRTNNGKRSPFNSRLIARLQICYYNLKSMAVGPTDIHPHKHFSPILAFCAPGPGMNRNYCIILVQLPRKKNFQLHIVKLLLKFIQLFPEFFEEYFTPFLIQKT